MNLRKENYIDRLIDKKIDEYLSIFGAVSLEGPKWCGKTWSALNHSKNVFYLDDDDTKNIADLSIDYLLNSPKPTLIDEWNLMPKVWDAVRRKCDDSSEKGKFILTCSTKLTDEKQKKEINHSGAGRIGKINMYPMSLYESGDSTGKVSITDMYNNVLKDNINDEITLEKLANLIVRGGWPSNINVPDNKNHILPKSYLQAILDKDMNDDKNRDKNKMNLVLKSLARNETTTVTNQTLLNDIEELSNNNDNILKSRITLEDYLDVLNRLHIISNQNSYSENYRSRERVGKSSKRHFVDPSLAVAALNLNKNMMIKDLNTFGLLFEALVERDLKIYMDYLDGNLYHFRDNVSGLEVDSILEFNNGDYAAIEIKLGLNKVEEAKKTLLTYYNNCIKKPKFMCVIVGNTNVIAKDKETGIYIVPITALKP